MVERGDGCAGDCLPCCGSIALAITRKEFFRTLPRRGQRTLLHLLVSPPGSLVFVEGDRLSNSFGLWALSKTGGSFLPGLTGRHMRDPTSPRFQSNFAIRHGQVSGNRKRLNYRHSGTIDTVERDYRHSGTFSTFWRRAGVVRCLFLVWNSAFGQAISVSRNLRTFLRREDRYG